MHSNDWNRRDVLAATLAAALLPAPVLAGQAMMHRKPIPADDASLPVIGLGTYSVFDVASTLENIAVRKAIVERLLDAGGSMLDTSPMYQRSEKVIGDLINAGISRSKLFLATKVWTDGEARGREQMQRSAELMNATQIDLMQVHNLRDTAVHMRSIAELQERQRVRYSGLTHYTAGAHEALIEAMQKYKPQFVQINYSLGEREAAERLLPLAEELGIAVIINRPFMAGALFRATADRALPGWATEFAGSWAQFFLKFIISHPAVNCAIPATSKPHHLLDNIGAGFGALPDAKTRQRMIDYFKEL